MLVLIGIYYHYNPQGFELFPRPAAVILITKTKAHQVDSLLCLKKESEISFLGNSMKIP